MHLACVGEDDTPHQPKHWPERVVSNANLHPQYALQQIGFVQSCLSRARSMSSSIVGQPVAFTLTEGTFLTMPLSSMRPVQPWGSYWHQKVYASPISPDGHQTRSRTDPKAGNVTARAEI